MSPYPQLSRTPRQTSSNRSYAERVHTHFQDGKGRWECPAISGTVGGSAEWQDLYRLRGSIERLFGHTKKHHGLSKDTHAYRGRGMATICTATIFAHADINKFRLWAATLPTPPEHPLLFSTEFEAPDLACDAEAA